MESRIGEPHGNHAPRKVAATVTMVFAAGPGHIDGDVSRIRTLGRRA